MLVHAGACRIGTETDAARAEDLLSSNMIRFGITIAPGATQKVFCEAHPQPCPSPIQ